LLDNNQLVACRVTTSPPNKHPRRTCNGHSVKPPLYLSAIDSNICFEHGLFYLFRCLAHTKVRITLVKTAQRYRNAFAQRITGCVSSYVQSVLKINKHWSKTPTTAFAHGDAKSFHNGRHRDLHKHQTTEVRR